MAITQRDMMRKVFKKNGGNIKLIVAEYASMEKLGYVSRKSNTINISTEQYAMRLLKDGVNKGWIYAGE